MPHVRRETAAAWLFVWAWAVGLLVSPGHFGSIDAERRFQVARAWWTAEPEVRADDTDFGIPGRDGRRRAWYGAGQSLIMLPVDLVVSTAVSLIPPLARIDRALDGAAVRVLVVMTLAPLLVALAVRQAYLLLVALGFAWRVALAGALSLLVATTLLHYAQLLQENVLGLLLMLTAVRAGLLWARGGPRRHLVVAGLCLGLELLVRLTSAIDVVAVMAFAGALAWTSTPDDDRRRRLRDLVLVIGGCVLLGLVLDRLYHAWRFGDWTTTYIGRFGEAARAADPALPAMFPFSTPFVTGWLGAFVSWRKSVFLFDPLLAATMVVLVARWRQCPAVVRGFAVAMGSVLLAQATFHARYFAWGGDAAWGDRFLVSPAQALAILAVPLALTMDVSRRARMAMWTVALVSVLVQVASTIFTFNLEIAQIDRGIGSNVVIGQRFWNIWTAVTTIAPGAADGLASMFRPAFAPWTFAPVLGASLSVVVCAAWWGWLALVAWLTWILARAALQSGRGVSSGG
ncbi:MAG: hypothetical protein ABS36_07175 [Acidobacteria bacterium SCN 69-37]|nr:MAG: hypothetical protein ABS36_07175 [Acidobacteria bacterium SCN 69-37]